MKKVFFAFFFVLTLTMLAITATAQIIDSGKCGNNLTWTLDDEGTLEISGRGDMSEWQEYTDVPWRLRYLDIKKAKINSGVTSIGNYAFFNFTELSEVIIGEDVTYIGVSAFWACPELTSITIPGSVTHIDSNAFESCWNLTDLTISSGVKDIGAAAFASCSSLVNVTIPDGVTYLGDCLFLGCTSLNKVTIPESVTHIGEDIFLAIEPMNVTIYGSKNSTAESYAKRYGIPFKALMSGKCGDNLTWMLDDVGTLTISGSGDMTDYEDFFDVPWYDFKDSIRLVEIEDGVTSIGNRAFMMHDKLIGVITGDGVKKIGSYAFYYCESLSSVYISNRVTLIDGLAFAYCYALRDITIPSSVKEIGFSAFYHCSNLTIHCYAKSAAEDYAKENNIRTAKAKVRNGDINADGAIDLKDVTTLRRYLAGGYDIVIINSISDINGDGSIDLKDVTTLRRYLAGGYGIVIK